MSRLPQAQHILMLFHDFAPEPALADALRLARGWRQRGRLVTILCGTVTGPLLTSVPAGVEIKRIAREIPRSPLSFRHFFRSLPYSIDRIAPDVLFLPDAPHCSLAGTVRHLPFPPRVVGRFEPEASVALPFRWPIHLFSRWAARNFDALIIGSSRLGVTGRRMIGGRSRYFLIENRPCETQAYLDLFDVVVGARARPAESPKLREIHARRSGIAAGTRPPPP